MKTLKKIAIALLVFAAVLPLAAGGSKESVASVDGPVQIELWFGAAMTEAGMIPDDWVGYDIIRDKLNIDLKLTMLPSNESDQDVKIQAAGAGNALPDVFMVRRPVLVNLVKQGLVAPVDDCFDKMPNRTALMYDNDAKAHATINGHIYGFPSPGMIIKNEGLLIRKDWLDKLGLEVPTTTEEFLEVARAFTFNDPDGNGVNDTYGYGAFIEVDSNLKGYPGSRLWPIMGAFGVEGLWSMKNGEEGLNIYKPEFYDATSNYAPFDKNFPDGEWIVIDAISGPEGKAAIGAYDMNYRIYAVSQKAVQAGKLDKICELLEWMSSDEGYYLLGWGTEGVNYVLDESGIPVAGDLGDMAFTGSKGQVYTQLRNIVFYNGDVELASRYPTYITEVSKKEMSALKTLREMQAMTWTNAIGSGNLPTPNADVKRFYEQTLGEFLTGARPLNEETWQAFIDGFNSIGGKAWNDDGVAYMKENGLLHD